MQKHRFAVGQTVRFIASARGQNTPTDGFRVVRLLPADGADNQYRLKALVGEQERVARESQLAF